MTKNIFTIAKKEATTYPNVVTLTANTGIALVKDYQRAESIIKELLASCYNICPFKNYEQLIAAYQVYIDSKSWAISMKSTPEYEWLNTLPKKNTPILLGIVSIFSNSSSGTWWATYTIIDNDSIFCKM
ncbi:hypothetical protein DWX77_11095 [Blautia obeum]|uniref:Uncharacterized protein n=1 Tax=Blautia obeum TaxID=40520 RepID=A0A412KTN5_9FIRM|nr:hypothetical protein DWX77_11095 [Blautia obeum]